MADELTITRDELDYLMQHTVHEGVTLKGLWRQVYFYLAGPHLNRPVPFDEVAKRFSVLFDGTGHLANALARWKDSQVPTEEEEDCQDPCGCGCYSLGYTDAKQAMMNVLTSHTQEED